MTDPKVIPLEGDSTVTIENPDAPVNEDETIMPQPTTSDVFPNPENEGK